MHRVETKLFELSGYLTIRLTKLDSYQSLGASLPSSWLVLIKENPKFRPLLAHSSSSSSSSVVWSGMQCSGRAPRANIV